MRRISAPSMLAMVWVAWTANAAAAADIVRVDEPKCSIRLTGEIVKGDREKLAAARDADANARNAEVEKAGATNAAAASPKSLSPSDTTLCLDSPGGSYAEAIRIVESVFDGQSLHTYIGENATCASACALVFLSGFAHEGEGLLSTHRTLHVRGKLALHAPYIPATSAVEKPALAMTLYREGVNAVADMLDVSSKSEQYEKFFPRSLLARALRTGPDEFFYVDTVDKVGMWDIFIDGTPEIGEITPAMIVNACRNSESWVTYSASAILEDPANGVEGETVRRAAEAAGLKPQKFRKGRMRVSLKEYGAEALFNCVFDAYRHATGSVHFQVQFAENGEAPLLGPDHLETMAKDLGDRWVSTAALGLDQAYLYLPATKLETLAKPK